MIRCLSSRGVNFILRVLVENLLLWLMDHREADLAVHAIQNGCFSFFLVLWRSLRLGFLFLWLCFFCSITSHFQVFLVTMSFFFFITSMGASSKLFV